MKLKEIELKWLRIFYFKARRSSAWIWGLEMHGSAWIWIWKLKLFKCDYNFYVMASQYPHRHGFIVISPHIMHNAPAFNLLSKWKTARIVSIVVAEGCLYRNGRNWLLQDKFISSSSVLLSLNMSKCKIVVWFMWSIPIERSCIKLNG